MSLTNEELLAKLEALQLQADRAEAAIICSNIMSRYVNYHAAFRHKDYVKFWAKRDDDILEMPWGKYYGYEGVVHCYLDHHKDRSDFTEDMRQAAILTPPCLPTVLSEFSIIPQKCQVLVTLLAAEH